MSMTCTPGSLRSPFEIAIAYNLSLAAIVATSDAPHSFVNWVGALASVGTALLTRVTSDGSDKSMNRNAPP